MYIKQIKCILINFFMYFAHIYFYFVTITKFEYGFSAFRYTRIKCVELTMHEKFTDCCSHPFDAFSDTSCTFLATRQFFWFLCCCFGFWFGPCWWPCWWIIRIVRKILHTLYGSATHPLNWRSYIKPNVAYALFILYKTYTHLIVTFFSDFFLFGLGLGHFEIGLRFCRLFWYSATNLRSSFNFCLARFRSRWIDLDILEHCTVSSTWCDIIMWTVECWIVEMRLIATEHTQIYYIFIVS